MKECTDSKARQWLWFFLLCCGGAAAALVLASLARFVLNAVS